ncbi:hypothetical protein A167_00198 [Alcanivorax sp. S71-1-4]|uniref:sulfite exporter TauE/SafE family protein n=1 Tax=Alcanivorax sp. S71-1-4 TaxID=1177159 RepID=UPI00135BE1D8|nr:sulfite exporter TauE/SafE family protein [Alcanivorax sp. S71-1-4]KAF0811166.1 hypothetical protein A167_00198 [Alcanivorax sp. S71-1-4]
MALELVPVYVLLGVLSGLLGGALGLGGGVVIVPGLLLVFHLRGLTENMAQLAVATSLATIIVTSVGAVRAHHQRGSLRWPLVYRLSGGIVVGAFAGAFIADWLSGPRLTQLFGVFAVLVAIQMMTSSWRKIPEGLPERVPGTPVLMAAGGGIGLVSSLFGIGGGSLTVPFMNACRVRMQEAVAVSSACGLPIALAGCIGFIIAGWDNPHLPPGSLGYVYLPAAVGIGIASYPMARVGAGLAHRLPAATLKRIFAVVLCVIGVRLALG